MSENLLDVVTKLQQQITLLEQRIEKLEKNKPKQQSNNSIVFNKPSMECIEWIKSLELTQDHLTLLFAQGYIQGMTMILCEMIEQCENPPIIGCSDKKKQFFTYINEKWQITDNKTFDTIRLALEFKIMKLFKTWKEENPKYLTDAYCEIYAKYYQNVMGTKLNKSAIIVKLKSSLYNALL